MRTTRIGLSLAIVGLFSIAGGTAQEAPVGEKFSRPTAATFSDGYRPAEGDASELRLTFFPDAAGGLAEPRLEVFASDGGLLKQSGYCTPRCYPRGKNPPDFCLIGTGCRGPGGGPSTLQDIEPLLVKFSPGPEMEVELVRDPAAIEALSANIGALELGVSVE